MKNLIRFVSFIPLLLLFLFSNSQYSFAQNTIVSGAGASVVNGIYLLDGTQNGKNKYTQDNSPPLTQHFIYWQASFNRWYIAAVQI